MVKIRCMCCDHEQEFKDAEEAYNEGWDVAPYFTCQPLCVLCPSAPVALHGLSHARNRHAESHKRWARDGRPAEFELGNEQLLDGAAFPKSEAEIKASVHALIAQIMSGQVKH